MPTATDSVPASLDVLGARERDAWQTYGAACHDPLATMEDRSRLFQAALAASTATANHEPGPK